MPASLRHASPEICFSDYLSLVLDIRTHLANSGVIFLPSPAFIFEHL